MRHHRQPEPLFARIIVEYALWQAARFWSEQEEVSGSIAGLRVVYRGPRGQRKNTVVSGCGIKLGKALMHLHRRPFVVVEAGAPQTAVVECEAQRPDQM